MVPSFTDPILKYALPVYGILLLTMVWRSVSRVTTYNDWPKIFAALGLLNYRHLKCIHVFLGKIDFRNFFLAEKK